MAFISVRTAEVLNRQLLEEGIAGLEPIPNNITNGRD